MMNNSNNSNLDSICTKHYLLNDKLHNALATGRLTCKFKDKKFINLHRFGVYVITFRVLSKNNPTLIYNYLFYDDLFTDAFLLYLIIRHRYTEDIMYNRSGGIYTFIDDSLSYGKDGIIKDLMNNPNEYNEYLNLELKNPNSKIKNTNLNRDLKDVLDLLKIYVHVRNLDDMLNLLSLPYMKDNKNFIEYLVRGTVNNIPSDSSLLGAKIIDKSVFIVRDLNNFINLVKTKTNYTVNQGSKKWRGQINSIQNFMCCFDWDFRDNLYLYNKYHVDNGLIPDRFKLSADMFSFDNIHKNLGNSYI